MWWRIHKINVNQKNFGDHFMPAVHSRQVLLARVSGDNCPRRYWESATLHSCRELSILAHNMRRQPGETPDPLTRAHGPLKKPDLNEARHERRDYTRGSKSRWVFPSTLSLSPCLGFPQWECTASIKHFVKILEKLSTVLRIRR